MMKSSQSHWEPKKKTNVDIGGVAGVQSRFHFGVTISPWARPDMGTISGGKVSLCFFDSLGPTDEELR